MTDIMKPLPFIRTTRPGHVDTMFTARSRAPSLTNSHRSADSISSQTTTASPIDPRADLATKFHETRALSPAFESDDIDDTSSLRSFAMSFSFKRPKWRLPFASTRRRPTSSVAGHESFNHSDLMRSTTPHHSRKLTSVHVRKLSMAQSSRDKPLPPSPTDSERAQELSCRRCYYSIARNCSGWVMGGNHGDACEGCLRDGFFGSP